MSSIIIPSRRIRRNFKPDFPVKLRGENPVPDAFTLLRDIQAQQYFDVARDDWYTISASGLVARPTPYGLGVHSGATGALFLESWPSVGYDVDTAPFTAIVVVNYQQVLSGTDYERYWPYYAATSAGTGVLINSSGFNYSLRSTVVTPLNAVDFGMHVVVMRITDGGDQQFWRNGFLDYQGTLATSWTAANSGFHIYSGGTSARGSRNSLLAAGWWSKDLGASYCKELSDEGWPMLLEPKRREIWVPMAGGGSSQTLTPTLFSNTNTFYSPTVSPGAVTLTPGLFTNSQTFYSATVSLGGTTQELTPTLFTNNQTFYSPTVSVGSVTITPTLFTNSQSFYSPTVTPGSVTLTPTLFTNEQTFYSAVVTQDGGTQYLIPSLVSNSNTFYAPSVTTGAVTITPDLFANTNSFYAATVSAGSVTLTPDLFTNTNIIYSATVTQSFGSQELFPEVVTNINQFFTAIVTTGPVTLTPGLFVNESIFYVATVTVGSTITDAELLAIADAVWSHPDAIAAHAKLDDILACCNG